MFGTFICVINSVYSQYHVSGELGCKGNDLVIWLNNLKITIEIIQIPLYIL